MLVELPPPQYFARIDENNLVVEVITATQDYIDLGVRGDPSTWIECAIDNTIRHFYPKPNSGDYYDPVADEFRPSKPFPSFIWNNYPWPRGAWIAPTPNPGSFANGRFYRWNEATLSWVETFPYPVPYPVNDQGLVYGWNTEKNYWELIRTLDPDEYIDEHMHLRQPLVSVSTSTGS